MIDNKLLQEIEEYCHLNNIDDIKKEINRMLRVGFNIDKYGVSPFAIKNEHIQNHLEENDETAIDVKTSELEETPKKKIRIIKN